MTEVYLRPVLSIPLRVREALDKKNEKEVIFSHCEVGYPTMLRCQDGRFDNRCQVSNRG